VNGQLRISFVSTVGLRAAAGVLLEGQPALTVQFIISHVMDDTRTGAKRCSCEEARGSIDGQ
jgi:hypothetical protein